MKKLFAILLAAAMLCSFACIGALAANDKLAELQAVIEEYNATHGGTGALAVSIRNGWAYTVTGDVRGATKGIDFPGECRLEWYATLTGVTLGEPLIKCPSILIFSGATIETNGCAIEGGHVSIEGGAITANEAIYAHDFGSNNGEYGVIAVSSGSIRGKLRLDTSDTMNGAIYIEGGAVTGAIEGNAGIFIQGDAAVNTTALSAPYISVSDSAQITFDENGIVRTTIVEVHAPATISFKHMLQNCLYTETAVENHGTWCPWNSSADDIDISDSVCAVIGNVVLDYDFGSQEKGMLIIPKGASLTVSAFYMWGNVRIDGNLIIQGKKYAGTYISIKGNNRWSLIMALLSNTTYLPKNNWWLETWQSPLWQFILRCVFFIQAVLGMGII